MLESILKMNLPDLEQPTESKPDQEPEQPTEQQPEEVENSRESATH